MPHLRPTVLVPFALLTFLFAGRTGALTVADWTAALASPTLAGAGVDASGRSLSYGHLELSFASGRLVPIVAADHVVGAYFHGHGTFRYVSADPFEAAVFRTNVRRNSSYVAGKDGSIGDAFESMLLYLSVGAEALAGGASWREGQVPAEVTTAFRDHLKRFAKSFGPPFRQLLAQAMIDPPPQPVVAADIVAAKEHVRFAYDTMRDLEESFSVLTKFKEDISFLKGRLLADQLSGQPIGRNRLDPKTPRATLTSLDLLLVHPGGLRAELLATETFRAGAPIKVLPLELWSRRIVEEGMQAALDQHDYTVKEVKTAEGETLPFSHFDGDLLVELPRTLAAGETVTLKFVIAGDVLFNPGNDSYWDLPTAPWYPTLPLDAQSMTYHAVVKVKKPFVPFSCGRTVRRWEEGEMSCAEFLENKRIQLPVVLAGKYVTESEERKGVTVRVSTYARADHLAVKALTDIVFGVIEFYKPFLGDYPFPELNVIEINAYGFGQAPPGIIFLTKEGFSPLQDEATRAFSKGVNSRIVHEIAHAWWGNVAKLSLQDQWISESVSEYFAAFALSKLKHPSEFSRAMDEWRGYSITVKDKASVYMANSLCWVEGDDTRQGLLYGKGPLVLHALRKELGDDLFFTVLKSFLKNFYFKNGETRQFIALTNFAAKKDYTEFFNRFLFGTEWPKK